MLVSYTSASATVPQPGQQTTGGDDGHSRSHSTGPYFTERRCTEQHSRAFGPPRSGTRRARALARPWPPPGVQPRWLGGRAAAVVSCRWLVAGPGQLAPVGLVLAVVGWSAATAGRRSPPGPHRPAAGSRTGPPA